MKKLFLLASLFCMPNMHGDSMDVIGGAAAGTIATGIIVTSYMSLKYREPNNHVVDKVNRFWRHVSENVAKVQANEFSRLIPVFKEFDIFIFDLENMMKYRYESWSAPWNWTSSMKQAYLQVQMLGMMFKYLEVISSWYAGIPDGALCQLAEKVVHGPGLVTNFIDELNRDIKKIDELALVLQCNFSTTLKNYLVWIRDIAQSSNAYNQERASFV